VCGPDWVNFFFDILHDCPLIVKSFLNHPQRPPDTIPSQTDLGITGERYSKEQEFYFYSLSSCDVPSCYRYPTGRIANGRYHTTRGQRLRSTE